LKIYGESAQREINLPAGSRGREAEVEELYDAVVKGAAGGSRRPLGCGHVRGMFGDVGLGQTAQGDFPFASSAESGVKFVQG
jgi:hypothetical protein